ncbi:MAG TPA: electron transfer flavoprotein subunit alpha/FixB family protein [bacterium]|nr:electron transfer flavoprotein subunit alpha/FixB family protein [bacterium]
MANVLVIAEVKEGKLKKVTLELLSKGQELASKAGGALEAVVLGSGVEALAGEMAQYGAAKVYVADDAALAAFNGEAYANVLVKLIEASKPGIVLVGASINGKDLAPRISAKIGAGLASDCTDLDVADGKLVVKRPIFAGKAFSKITFKSDIQIASVRPNVNPLAAPNAGASPVVEKIDAAAGDVKAKILETHKSAAGKIELTEAEIIVSGGRGMKGPENYKLIEDMAAVLGAAVGASRAAVDAGWRPHGDQVGQTGKTVNPNLYVACGISGAIQHLAGMSSSKCIVAINKDAEAPIFKVADYGIVGDLFTVVPLMTDELKKLLA